MRPRRRCVWSEGRDETDMPCKSRIMRFALQQGMCLGWCCGTALTMSGPQPRLRAPCSLRISLHISSVSRTNSMLAKARASEAPRLSPTASHLLLINAIAPTTPPPSQTVQ